MHGVRDGPPGELGGVENGPGVPPEVPAQNRDPPEQSLGVGVAAGAFGEQYWGPPEQNAGVGVAVGAEPEQYCGPGNRTPGLA